MIDSPTPLTTANLPDTQMTAVDASSTTASKISQSGGKEKFMRKRGGFPRRFEKEVSEFDQQIVDLARVTRVTKGGKQMKFRSCVIIGDRKGRVGVGVAKAADVSESIAKSVRQAKKNLVVVPLVEETIPYPVEKKYKAARVFLKPAIKGSGIKAGGAMRIVFQLAGVPNIVAKMKGSSNKINVVRATIEAIRLIRKSKRLSK